jgi:hypothetical protein
VAAREVNVRHGACRHIRNLVVMGAIALRPVTPVVLAQTASEPALKAAFLFNFPKFTEWPGEILAAGDPLLLCVVNDSVVAGLLETHTKARTAAGRALMVATMTQDSPALSSCGVLFMAGLDPARRGTLLQALSRKPILTVGDGEGFARAGGVVGLFIKDGTLQFAINTVAAERAGLRLSSKLLSLAKLVKEDGHATRR